MKINILNILLTDITLAITWFFSYLIFEEGFSFVKKWYMQNSQKVLFVTPLLADRFLTSNFPLVFIFPILIGKLNYVKEFIKWTFICMVSIIEMLGIGTILTGLFWTNIEPHTQTFLNETTFFAPFDNYWTIFILIGIFIPFILVLKKIRNK